MATLIHPDGRVETRKSKGKKWTLEELQACVDGFIQLIPRTKPFVIVNEEGRLRGMIPNPEASARVADMIGMPIVLVGPVLFFERGVDKM